MSLRRRAWLLLAVVALSVGCDQTTKHWALGTLKKSPTENFLGGLFRLEYAENPGAFLSLGSKLDPGVRTGLLTGAVGIFLAGLLAFALMGRALTTAQVVAYGLTLGGGWSNWFDRLVNRGLVVDFLNLGIGPVRTGIFNVADLAIVAGIAVLVLAPRAKPAATGTA